jgi:septal ring factor EnvC (AmiA/AmiB activator)
MTPFMKVLIIVNSLFSCISLLYVSALIDRYSPDNAKDKEISKINTQIEQINHDLSDAKSALEKLNADVVPRR